MFDNNRLKQRRLDMGLTLEEVGNVVGISRSAVQKHEKGIIKNVYTSTVELFGKALRCSPAYLMRWEDNPNPPSSTDDEKITRKEMEIIKAYREQPELRVAVERVLGIHNNDTPSINSKNALILHHDVEAASEVDNDLERLDMNEFLKNNRKTSSVD